MTTRLLAALTRAELASLRLVKRAFAALQAPLRRRAVRILVKRTED